MRGIIPLELAAYMKMLTIDLLFGSFTDYIKRHLIVYELYLAA